MCAMVQGLVSGRTLHDFARGLHMQRHLALDVSSQWEAKHLFGWADGMLADSFEALLAALFLDRGHRAANSLIMRLIKVSLPLWTKAEWFRTSFGWANGMLADSFEALLAALCLER